MNELENYDTLFNPQIDLGGTSRTSSEEYKVSADKGKGGVYQSVIRFIPYWKNPKKSLIEKWVSWLVDPVTSKGRFVDCPSSVGLPSLLQDMYWKLKKSESIIEQKKADIFSRRHNFGALIQVIKDDNQQDLEGKIMYFSFGKKIWEKIDAEMKPIIGQPHNPFDILHGKAFALVVTKVSGYNNYDQSKFVDTVIPLCIPDEKNKLIPIKDSTNKQEVFEFLKTNSPDMDKYGFKEWDSDTKDYVNHVIAAVTGQNATAGNYESINNSVHGATATDTHNTNSKPTGSISVSDINIEDMKSDSGLGDLNLPDLPSMENLGGIGNVDDLVKNL